MRYKIYIIFFLLSYDAQAYICSINFYNKDKSYIISIGTCHALEKTALSNQYSYLLSNLNKLNRKTSIIIEGSTESYLSNCLFLDLEKTKSLYKSTNFILSDIRSQNLLLFLRNYRLWAKAKILIDIINLQSNESYNIFPDLSKNINFEQAITEIEDNIKEINFKITKNNISNNFINNLKTKIENCFDKFIKNLDSYKNFSNTDNILNFIEIIELDLADLNFILEILAFEKDNQIIVIVTGNDHTININNFLRNINYKLAIPSIGLSHYLTDNIYPACLSKNDLETKFSQIFEILKT